MVISKKMISTKNDFPNVEVWQFEMTEGPAWTVEFWNREWGLGMKGWVFAAVLVGFFFWAWLAGRNPEIAGKGTVVLVSILLPLVMLFLIGRQWTKWVWRSIEIVPANNQFRVMRWFNESGTLFKHGTTEIVKDLDGWKDMEVRDHPDADYERQERSQQDPQIRTDRRLSRAEKSHVLIGYFGARGADKVILFTRAEWPTRHSLAEVQQAFLWTMEHIAGWRGDRGPGVARGGNTGIKPPAGINPPLD